MTTEIDKIIPGKTNLIYLGAFDYIAWFNHGGIYPVIEETHGSAGTFLLKDINNNDATFLKSGILKYFEIEETKPVYTKEMQEAGEFPSVGFSLNYRFEFITDSEFQYLSNEKYGWEDGDNLEVIKIVNDSIIVLNVQDDVLTSAAITDLNFFKPMELINCEPYMFRLNGQKIGFYRKDRKSFFTELHGGNKICGENEPSKITQLTTRSK